MPPNVVNELGRCRFKSSNKFFIRMFASECFSGFHACLVSSRCIWDSCFSCYIHICAAKLLFYEKIYAINISIYLPIVPNENIEVIFVKVYEIEENYFLMVSCIKYVFYQSGVSGALLRYVFHTLRRNWLIFEIITSVSFW